MLEIESGGERMQIGDEDELLWGRVLFLDVVEIADGPEVVPKS
jgi:hypothetical protein